MTKRRFLGLLGAAGGLLAKQWSRASEIIGGTHPGSRGRLLQGPMVGAVTPTSARIWLRASDRFLVSISYGRTPDLANARRTAPVRPEMANGYCAVLTLDGLAAGRRYWYRVLFDDAPDSYAKDKRPYAFRTAPEPGRTGSFSAGFGSCARYAQDPVQPIWSAVAQQNPDLFFWIGDNIYGDSGSPVALEFEYARQREVGSYRPLASRIPQLAIWDDHDFGFNDADSSNPAKADALQVFKSFWANPHYGTETAPGVFFDYSYGGVDFFFLDVRYYRDPNDAPDRAGKTMLGKEQKAWLKEHLASSSAPFKMLVSASGWTKAKGFGGDSWASFMTEREELFEFIRRQSISGVVLLSGDTHVAELNAIPWSARGGYDLYDLTSSPLAQIPSVSWLDRRPELRIRQVYPSSSNFGLLTFSMQGDPVLTYNVFNHQGEAVWEPFTVRASELKNGVSTWKEKMDDLSRVRFERQQRGEPYYY